MTDTDLALRIVAEPPPNFDAICEAFPAAKDAPVVFCYGDVLYNPKGLKIEHWLMAHELVHSARQKGDPAGWWERYCEDPMFRLKEELQAHKAEYAYISLGVKDRNQRARLLNITARRLASPLYGGIIPVQDALLLLRK